MSQEQLEIIRAAFRRLRLTGEDEPLATPFHSIHGEAEQAAAFFFEIGGQIVAAKLPEEPASLRSLWNEVREFRARGEHPALLPMAGNEESDRVLVYQDGHWIAQALRRLGLLAEGTQVPRPRRVMSGLAGYSRLYLIPLTGTMDVLVKFDRPDRLRHESHAIDAIRHSGKILPELQLPLPGNSQADDGIFLTQIFENKTAAREVMQLSEFLTNQLLTSREHVAGALALLGKFLRGLYSDAFADSGTTTWGELNPELTNEEAFLPLLKPEGILGPGRQEFRLVGLPALREFVNPVCGFPERLKKETGRLLRATTHGDLQSTNVLVGLGFEARPDDIAIIDIEKLAPDQPVVEDLVRIEADFWRSVFTAIAARVFHDRIEDERVRATSEAMLLALDKLEGRAQQVRTRDEATRNLADAAAHFIFSVREMAWNILAAGKGEYWPSDYFGALRFYYLKAMLRPLVNKNRLRMRVVLLGASMAEDVVRAMERGLVTGEQGFLRKWTDGFAGRLTRAAATHAPGPYSRATIGSLGAATSIFSQPGLIVTSIREVVNIFEHGICLRKEAAHDPSGAFVLADQHLAPVTGTLNAQAFRRQRWAGTGLHVKDNALEKTVRNRAHIDKNPFTILLIKAPAVAGFDPADRFVGMTHVIPLNDVGFSEYTKGKVEDNLLGPELIAKPSEESRALLLFSFALDTMTLRQVYRDAPNQGSGRTWMYAAARQLVRGMAFHVHTLMREQANVASTELLTQNDNDPGMLTVFDLLHFEPTRFVSGDGSVIRSVLCGRCEP